MTTKEKTYKYAMPTFGDRDFTVAKGKGCKLYDEDGNEYLDFGAGIAVDSIGHCHPRWVKAIAKQAETLAHCSNLYMTKPNADLCEKLVSEIGAGKIFLCNSGTEANEALIKAARLYGRKVSGKEGAKCKIVTAYDGFHGRTMGCVAATAQKKIQKGFAPMLGGFDYAVFNDLASFEKVVDDDTAAVIVEPVQGESGVTPASPKFLKGLKALCKKHKALLFFDEVQCGFGRCGAFLASQRIGVKPTASRWLRAWAADSPSARFGFPRPTQTSSPQARTARLSAATPSRARRLWRPFPSSKRGNSLRTPRRWANAFRTDCRKLPKSIRKS